jgi:hypothetical protein
MKEDEGGTVHVQTSPLIPEHNSITKQRATGIVKGVAELDPAANQPHVSAQQTTGQYC